MFKDSTTNCGKIMASFVTIHPHRVITLCNQKLDQIQKERDNALEELIQKQMNRRFFKAKTREKALNRISDWEKLNIKIWCGLQEKRVKYLLRAAQNTDSYMQIDVEEYNFLVV